MATTPTNRWVSRHKCAQILSSFSSLCPSSTFLSCYFFLEEEEVKGISLTLLVQKYGILPCSILSPNEWQTLPLQLLLQCCTISKGKTWGGTVLEQKYWMQVETASSYGLEYTLGPFRPWQWWTIHRNFISHFIWHLHGQSEMLIMCFFFFSLLLTELFL